MINALPIKSILLTIFVAAGLFFSLACRGDGAATGLTTPPGAAQPPALMGPASAQASAEPQRIEDAPLVRGTNGLRPRITALETPGTGIRVSGQGQASGSPDLAILRMGVESFASSVADARTKAADAMEDVVSVLQEEDVEDKDIQTRFFNVSPRYTSREVTRCIAKTDGLSTSVEPECLPQREQVITGYEVGNGLTVIVRDLEGVDAVIDRAIDAGGDLIRFQGISFTIEDTSSLEENARANAVRNMQDKAEQLASNAGVELGRLIYINERSSPSSFAGEFAAPQAFALEAKHASTQILPGEQTMTVTVEGVFAIE